jgi:hypothetical protein
MKKDLLKGLSDEQIAKVRECKSSKDLISLAKAEGIELSEEQLSAVNGGGCFSSNKCPDCGSKDYLKRQKYRLRLQSPEMNASGCLRSIHIMQYFLTKRCPGKPVRKL